MESRLDRQRLFSSLDNEISGSNDNHGNQTDSDDSASDPSSISESQLKVLKSSLNNLRKKLLEKCAENDALQKELRKKDAELDKLRDLNRKHQEILLDRMTQMSSKSSR